jgi:segregation and condensation protein A
VDLLELLQAVERVIAAIPDPVLHRVVPRPLDVEGATRRLNTLLDARSEFGWLEALGPAPTITDILSTLLALLELARGGTLILEQPAPFAPMVIRRDASRPAD